jgi:hypothetical protein
MRSRRGGSPMKLRRFIRSPRQRALGHLGDCDAYSIRCFKVDDQVKLGRELDWQITRLVPSEIRPTYDGDRLSGLCSAIAVSYREPRTRQDEQASRHSLWYAQAHRQRGTICLVRRTPRWQSRRSGRLIFPHRV